MKLTSTAFADGQRIPTEYTGDGEDLSPPLAWDGVPEGVQRMVLICDDPDAPVAEPWVHWVLYDVPASVRSLPEGFPPDASSGVIAGARQGQNSWPSGRKIGYRGPLPPAGHGVHHYRFHLYALDAAVPLPDKTDKATVLKAIAGHVLAEARLVGTYER